jgi:chemotaxis protein methyltransferase CheR
MERPSDSLGLSSSALPLLRDVIHDRLGLFYDPPRFDALADRLAPLVVARGFDSYLDYYYLLKYDEAAADEWLRVIDALSVNETYFWREIDQIQAVARVVVPALLRERPAHTVRIWSIPCATGEEPLTIAMALDQAGMFERGAIQIHASDASPAAIEKARLGRFRERSFRNLPPELRARYFDRDGDTWTVNSSLHQRVTTWSVVNLMAEAEVAPRAHVHIIFCRNVFIYFSAAGVQRVIRELERLTPTPAYLCVGASESLLRTETRFTLDEIGGAFVYVKRDAAGATGRSDNHHD